MSTAGPIAPPRVTICRRAGLVEMHCDRWGPASDDVAASLWRALPESIRPGGPLVHVRLEGVRQSDTNLVAVLVHAVRRARECRTLLAIRPTDAVRRVFEIRRLEQLLAS
ncbi:MAG: STAS domain-containing protein [Planctomycetota bacterium]